MTSVIRYTHWAILRIKRPRISMQPTQFQNLSKIFKIEFPGNWTKSLIYPESAWFTDSFPFFENKKIAHRKKLWRFLLPEFNLLETVQFYFSKSYSLFSLDGPLLGFRTVHFHSRPVRFMTVQFQSFGPPVVWTLSRFDPPGSSTLDLTQIF